MSHKKLTLLLAIVSAALCALGLVVAGPEAGAQERIQMKIATVAPEGTPWEKQLKQFKRYVEEGSQGRIQVKMFMGGSLGGEKALVRRASQGTIQVFGGSAAALGSLVPELDASTPDAGPVAVDAGPDCRCSAWGNPRNVGTIGAPLVELSGLVASRPPPGVLFAHNDSGDTARFFSLSTPRVTVATF